VGACLENFWAAVTAGCGTNGRSNGLPRTLIRGSRQMTDEELEEWLEGYLSRNPGKRPMIEGALAVTSSPETRREVIEHLQEDEAAQARRREGRT
jgi:hypothetical protein